MSDPELAKKATTPEGYKDAKKVVRDCRETANEKRLAIRPRSSQVVEPVVIKT